MQQLLKMQKCKHLAPPKMLRKCQNYYFCLKDCKLPLGSSTKVQPEMPFQDCNPNTEITSTRMQFRFLMRSGHPSFQIPAARPLGSLLESPSFESFYRLRVIIGALLI